VWEWEVGPRPGSGSNHLKLEDPATGKRSGLNERLQLKDARHRYSQSGKKRGKIQFSNTVPVPALYRELDVDYLKPYYVP
jgi:hypothetical protein